MKKTLAIILSLVMVVGMIGTVAWAESESQERITFTAGAMNLGIDQDKEFFPSDWIVYLQDSLNIDLEWTQYDDDTGPIALASNDLPYIMMVNTKLLPDVIRANQAVNLDDYLDEYGQNIKKFELRNQVLREYLSGDTNQLLFHTPNSGYEDVTANTSLWHGFLVRWDLYKEIGAPEIKTDDDYIEVLKQMYEIYPATEGGDPVYGFGQFNNLGLWGWMMRAAANMGNNMMANYTLASDFRTNELINHLVETDPSISPFWSNMEFYNKMWREGLLDPDSFSMTTDETSEKYAKGQYLGGMCTWYTGDTYRSAALEDPNTLKGIISIQTEGMHGWYGQNAFVGWDGKYLFVTTSTPDELIPRAVGFIDFLDSDEANRVHYSGVQGKYWDYDENGVPSMLPAAIEARSIGGDTWSKTGINTFSNFIGSSGFGMHSDGYYYNLFDDSEIKYAALNSVEKDYCDYYGLKYPSEKHYNLLQEGKAFNQSEAIHTTINMLMGDIPSNISRISTRIEEMMIRALPTLVQAENNDAFAAAQEQFIAEVQEAGLDQIWDFYYERWYTLKGEVEAMLEANA